MTPIDWRADDGMRLAAASSSADFAVEARLRLRHHGNKYWRPHARRLETGDGDGGFALIISS